MTRPRKGFYSDTHKECTKCHEIKTHSEYPIDKWHGGITANCYSCHAKRMQIWRNSRENPKEHSKRMLLKSKYGITLEHYNELLIQQQYKCVICLRQFKSTKDTNCDHNHKTGTFRGILCTRCNTTLGKFNDNIILFENMINYIKKHENV